MKLFRVKKFPFTAALKCPPGRVGMEVEIELFPFSSPVRKGGVIDYLIIPS
jgi:hypothetical protein